MAITSDSARQLASDKIMQCFEGDEELDCAGVVGADTIHELEMREHELVYTGVTIIFTSARAQTAFVDLAKKLFARTKGEHIKDGSVLPDYRSAIMRLPSEIMTLPVDLTQEVQDNEMKIYPLHLSDAALEVLSKPHNIRKIQKYYMEEEMQEANKRPDYSGTKGQKVVQLRPKSEEITR